MTCNFFLQSHVHTSYFPAYAPNAHYIPKEYIEMLEKVANDFMISNGKVTGKCEDSKSCSACLKVVNHSLINIRVLEVKNQLHILFLFMSEKELHLLNIM